MIIGEVIGFLQRAKRSSASRVLVDVAGIAVCIRIHRDAAEIVHQVVASYPKMAAVAGSYGAV